ncbi:hypothetical protein ACIRU5_20455 [Streptomyces misionensis]|uniref:hypothetical protein n=1 Tax=Streptomyces misionensis TaxID=67331 RepID=UPI0038169272
MADTLPNPASDNTTRFEAAPDPDGTLIPIPSEAPQGKAIRDDAQITVSERRESGYYVTIYNGPPDPPSEVNDIIEEFSSEALQKDIEHAVGFNAAPAVLRFVGAAAGVLASVLTTSPLLNEQLFRGTMDDGTAVTYAVLTPQG